MNLKPIGVRSAGYAELSGLSPAYFGVVMATGIVPFAAYLLGMPVIGGALLVFKGVVYLVRWLFTLLRLLRYQCRFFDDLIDHLRGPGFSNCFFIYD